MEKKIKDFIESGSPKVKPEPKTSSNASIATTPAISSQNSIVAHHTDVITIGKKMYVAWTPHLSETSVKNNILYLKCHYYRYYVKYLFYFFSPRYFTLPQERFPR